MGGLLSRLHEGHRRLRDRAACAGAAGRPRGAAEAPRRRPELERRLVLREWRHPRTLEQIRYETLLNYGQSEAEAKVAAKSWAKIYDGHSLVTLRRAIDGFDITKQYDQLKQTKVLYVISKTDKLFDLTDCAAHALDMRKAGVDLTYVEMPSEKGHMASHADAAMWAPILSAFLKQLT